MAGGTHLVEEEPLLHAVVGTDLLEDVPGKLAVELPGHEARGDGSHSDDDRNGDEEGPDGTPDVLRDRVGLERVVVPQIAHGATNLVNLKRRVDQQGEVGQADSDDLDGVLHPQRVPGQDQQVQETEDEEGEEGRDCPNLRVELGRGELGALGGNRSQGYLESGEDIAAAEENELATLRQRARPVGSVQCSALTLRMPGIARPGCR